MCQIMTIKVNMVSESWDLVSSSNVDGINLSVHSNYTSKSNFSLISILKKLLIHNKSHCNDGSIVAL
jgi:hypothetical protein